MLPGAHADAGDAAAGPALGAHLVGAEVQQLGVRGDEAQLLVAGAQLDGADHLVAVGQPDHLPRVPVAEHLGVDALDDPVAGAEHVARAVGLERREREHPLARLERQELGHRRTALQVRMVGGPGQRRQVEHVELDEPAEAW